MFPQQWKSSCELQGMHSLQRTKNENILTSPFETTHSSLRNQRNPTHSTRSNIRSNNQTKFLRSHKYTARATYKQTLLANQQYARLEKYAEKPV
jgi:hypothetical protein